MDTAFVIGNGESRNIFPIKNIVGDIFAFFGRIINNNK